MFIRFSRGIPALGCPIDEPQLQEIRFDYFHNRVCFFADRGSDRTEADRSAVVFFNNCQQHTPVNIIQTGDVLLCYGDLRELRSMMPPHKRRKRPRKRNDKEKNKG